VKEIYAALSRPLEALWPVPPSLDPDVLDQLFSSSSTASSGYVLPPWR
jgi:hypothetical protein